MCFLFVLRSHLMQKMSLKIPYQQLVVQNHVPQPVSGQQDSELSPSYCAFLRAPQPVPLGPGYLSVKRALNMSRTMGWEYLQQQYVPGRSPCGVGMELLAHLATWLDPGRGRAAVKMDAPCLCVPRRMEMQALPCPWLFAVPKGLGQNHPQVGITWGKAFGVEYQHTAGFVQLVLS